MSDSPKEISKKDIIDLLSLSDEQSEVLGLSETSVVRAGAGAGKTTTLVAALLYDILVEGLPPGEIAVTTFTRAAAANLRSRLEESLWKVFSENAPDVSGLWLGTIDALALRYLRSHALREGMDPGISPARRRDLLFYARQAFENIISDGLYDPLIRAFAGEDNLYRELLLFDLYAESKGIEHFSVFSKERAEGEEILSALEELALSGVGEKSYALLEEDIYYIKSGQAEKMKKESKWNMRRQSDDFLQAQDLRRRWRQGEIDNKLLPLREGAEELSKSWQNEYSRLRKKHGLFSYTDILRLALDIAKPRFRRIYVDEAQDTSFLQRRLIKKLSKGEVIFIGDKNQSIYHFRGADTSLWEEETEGLPEVILRDNYRSGEEILRFVEKACGPLLGDDLLPMRGKREGGSVSILCAKREEDESPAISEARTLLPGVLEEIAAKGYSYSDVAILLPGNEDINAYYRVLREMRIPALALRAKGLLRETECQDLKAYLTFLADTSDERALLRLLSSPFFSLTREELLYLGQRKESLEISLLETLPAEEIDLLEKAMREKGVERPSTILRRAIERHAYDLSLELLDATGVMRDNTEAFLGILEEIEDEEGLDLSGILRSLEREEEADDDGQDKELPRGREAVRLLTIHRAKGDEFPVVILGRCSRRKKYASNRILLSEGELGLSLSRELRDSVAEIALEKETELLQAEGNRLFYVGLTRAEKELYLLASLDARSQKLSSPLSETGLSAEEWERPEEETKEEGIVLSEDEEFIVSENLYHSERLPEGISWTKLASWEECSLRRDLELLALQLPEGEEGGGSGARLLGDKIHTLLARDIRTGNLKISDYPKEGQEMIKALGESELLEEIGAWEEIDTEVPFLMQADAVPLRGRIDLLAFDKKARRAWLLDWKSGEDDHFHASYQLQRKIYALAVLSRSDTDSVRASTYYLRSGQLKEEEYSDQEALRREVVNSIEEIIKRPGKAASQERQPFCSGCPGLLQVCPVASSSSSSGKEKEA